MPEFGVIAAFAAGDANLGLILQGHGEGEHVFPVLRFFLFPVQVKRHFVLVGIHLHGELLFCAVPEPLGADMHEGLLAPVGFVQIETIFLGLAVKGDEALMVHARFAALIPGVSGKVEHIPDVGGPHVGIALKALEQIFVINGLVFLGVVSPAGMGGMEVGHSLAAVFGIAQAPAGIDQMEEAHPHVVEPQPRHVPAQVQVPAYHVGDVSHFVEGAAHGVAGQGGEAVFVHFMHQVVEHVVVVQHVLFVLGGNSDFIADAPAHDGGMVIVLNDQLLHLADGVFPALGHMLGNVRDFRPYHHAALVAQVIEVLIVLVVGQTDGVGPDLADQIHVLFVHFLRQRVAHAFPVLVPGNAAQGIGFAVQIETGLWMIVEIPHTEAALDFVHGFPVHRQGGDGGIQVGAFQAVPQVHVGDIQVKLFSLTLGHFFAIRV